MATLETEQLMLSEIRRLERKFGLRIVAVSETKPNGKQSAYLCFAPLEAVPHSPVYVRRPKRRGKLN